MRKVHLVVFAVGVVAIGVLSEAIATGQAQDESGSDSTVAEIDAYRDRFERAWDEKGGRQAFAYELARLKAEIVPVGGVIMWWGDKTALPNGFEICDGNDVTTPEAILTGKKPNLTDRFPKGAPVGRESVGQMQTGGNNNMPGHTHALGSLRVDEGGEHEHEVRGTDDDSGDDTKATTGQGDDRPAVPTRGGGRHRHSLSGRVGNGSVDGDGNDNTGANQPAFQELFFLIRVK